MIGARALVAAHRVDARRTERTKLTILFTLVNVLATAVHGQGEASWTNTNTVMAVIDDGTLLIR